MGGSGSSREELGGAPSSTIIRGWSGWLSEEEEGKDADCMAKASGILTWRVSLLLYVGDGGFQGPIAGELELLLSLSLDGR